MRERIGGIVWGTDPRWGHAFDYAMLALIMLSVLGMSVETVPGLPPDMAWWLAFANIAIVGIFTAEYAIRIWTAERPLSYVFSFWGIVDLVAFLPFWLAIGTGSQGVRLLRLIRLLKMLRYMAAIDRIRRAVEIVWKELLVFLAIAALMLIITAIGIYNFESQAQPEVFRSIPHSLWFAVTTLTTVGYGDAYPVTAGGKFFTFLILMIGLGIVALPTGLVSAAFMQAKEEEDRRRKAKAGTAEAKAPETTGE